MAAITEDEVVAKIRALHPDAVIDLAEENCSFEVYIIDEGFEGQGTLQRQRPILALFKDDIVAGDMHALTIIAKTPAEQKAGSGLIQISLD